MITSTQHRISGAVAHGKFASKFIQSSRISSASRVLGLLLVGSLTGCSLPSVGPNYEKPETPTATAYKDSSIQDSSPAKNRIENEWWRDFGDSDLDGYVAQALVENQNIKGAAARVEQALALTGLARSSLLPMVGAAGLATREQTSETTTNQFPHSLTTTYRAPLTASWELDLFGRVRRLNESANANLRATKELADATRLAVAAETATTYFALSATDHEERIVAEFLALQKETLVLVEARRDAGRSSDVAVAQARLAVAASEADLSGVANRRAALSSGLAILLGKAAPSFEISKRHELKGAPPQVPAGLPSELLLRRPDLAAAESGLKAASAQIGVAKSAFFPAISLTGSAGFASSEIDALFKSDSRTWSVGPSLYLPLFQGGRIRANYKRSHAAYAETLAGYRQAVLGAFREVQDALSASQYLRDQSEAFARAEANAQQFKEFAEERYRAGATSYLDVIEAQRTALAVERNAAAIAGQRWITQVMLIRALGGGWEQPKSQ